ncbi:hypothetical protein C2G38_2158313 [Gigaspora rosea]|uniref:Uncharacterized protein n=1 Tax=Gigaspora rosea TaxID=44941 RepID=A0A397W9T8_9GLOM|nr:hypothetical protein C2G38_2158313 [Gigaspora rosea]
MNPSSKDILTTIVVLTLQSKESVLQTSLTIPNFEIECVVESDEQLDNKLDKKLVMCQMNNQVLIYNFNFFYPSPPKKSSDFCHSPNISNEQSNNESKEQLKLYKDQVFQMVKEAHITLSLLSIQMDLEFVKNMSKRMQMVIRFQGHFYAIMLKNKQPKIDHITQMNLVHVVLIVTRRSIYTGVSI